MALNINCQGKCQLCSCGALFENNPVECGNCGVGKWNSSVSIIWKLYKGKGRLLSSSMSQPNGTGFGLVVAVVQTTTRFRSVQENSVASVVTRANPS